MFLVVRTRLHTSLRYTLLPRLCVRSTHAGPTLAASVTPVEKILLDTIKVPLTGISTSIGITIFCTGKWSRILRDLHATLPLPPNRGVLYEPRKPCNRCAG